MLTSLCLFNFALLIFFYVVSVKWVKKIQAMEKKIYQLQKVIKSLQTADIRFSRKVDELQQEAEQMSVSSMDPSDLGQEISKNETYRYALKLLQMGMNLEDVMETCKIGHAEADLLQNLEGYQKISKRYPTST